MRIWTPVHEVLIKVLEDADKFLVYSCLHGTNKDTVSVVVAEDKKIFATSFGGYREMASEVGRNLFSCINNI